MQGISVAAYFADDPTRVYQLAQWLPVLEILDQREPVGLVVRQEASAAMLRERTHLQIGRAHV